MLALLVVNVYSKQFTVDSLQLTTTERLQVTCVDINIICFWFLLNSTQFLFEYLLVVLYIRSLCLLIYLFVTCIKYDNHADFFFVKGFFFILPAVKIKSSLRDLNVQIKRLPNQLKLSL